ncbi:hypothetical protein L614_002400000210 [Ochrobactrum sp. J50]|nr:hypothetical protein L614_002400000210 [Ochrobactrum sp. J50]
MLEPLDVILVFDVHIDPAKPKFWVCLCPDEGIFFRINSKSVWRPCFPISREDNKFLDHDSYVECNLLELDEYLIREAIVSKGKIGRLGIRYVADINRHLLQNRTIPMKLRQKIMDLLNSI